MTEPRQGFTTYVYSRELPPNPRIDLVRVIGATYVSAETVTFPDLATPSHPRCEISMPSGGAGRPWSARSSPDVTRPSRHRT
jgi:hypothetical protein